MGPRIGLEDTKEKKNSPYQDSISDPLVVEP
jgi:hypothetical protein